MVRSLRKESIFKFEHSTVKADTRFVRELFQSIRMILIASTILVMRSFGVPQGRPNGTTLNSSPAPIPSMAGHERFDLKKPLGEQSWKDGFAAYQSPQLLGLFS